MKFKISLIATFIYILLLLVIYYIHCEYFLVDVVFYSALIDSIIALFVAILILMYVRYFRVFTSFEKSLLVMIWILGGYSYAISIPTVLDRSLSFYILEKLQQRGGGIKLDAFDRVFTQEYVKEHRLVDVRLTEQEQSGTISINEGCVKLTAKGKRMATFSRYFRAHFLPKRRLLMGEYSDDLTDPFRHSVNITDYAC